MEKILKLDLLDKGHFFEPYNKNVVSRSLIDYMIDIARRYKKDVSIKIVINKEKLGDIDCESLIRDGLNFEYKNCLRKYNRNNWLQLLYIFLGIMVLLLTMISGVNELVRQILVITGWVLIWTACEVEFITDLENRSKRKTIKKLLNAKYVEEK